MRFSYLLVLLIITSSVKSQVSNIDSIYGNIKRVREKVFDISNKENPKQVEIDEYSDSMILIPNSLNLSIYDSSFSGSQSGYENYEQFYNENGKIVKHIWFVKKDEFYRSTSYQYDEKNRVTKEIDSFNNSVYRKKHYYEDFDNYTHENIFSFNLDSDFFNHTINLYKDKQVIRKKIIDEYGNMTEFINNYNENGKLKFTVFKNPETWRKNEEGNWSHGVHDSIPNVYKNIVNEYDEKNRILKSLEYGYSKKNNYTEPILLHQVLYNYEKNKTTVKTIYESGSSSSFIYIYDNKKRIIEYYCCSDKINESKLIRKYNYENDRFVSMTYIDFLSDKANRKEYKITFSYKFDDKNNWIEMMKIVNGKNSFKRTRQIEYY